ncbi:HNH endonuclease [Bradyrhizobium sp. 186]|uniref:HNH endonuclease n=1 Tax=Bradyrhizobium sp. 186 TaxID=2782654 RepID=UPI002000C4AD|nr:HNH endonuclease [Bradyrhizobium sp. 186]UPK39536.1 HNH endonuclease [Bradyrhizobium sp. 186]
MANKKVLNEYEAAVASGMSPDLLRWLTKNPPKHADTRVLKVAKIENNRYFYEEEELLSFNNWLKSPWPHKDGKRPNIPAEIRREIKVEANGECAICRSNKDSCEAAHLEPVAKTFNNHPENLLWLCSNHHTSYDKGLFFGPKPEDADFVQGFKQALHYFKRSLWLMQQELSHKLFAMLQTCDVLAKQLEAPKTKDQIEAIEDLAKKAIAAMPVLAPLSKTDPKYEAYQAISADVASLSNGAAAISVRLRKAQDIRRDYVATFGFVACPLCQATGRHEGTDCPVCNGDREIEEHFADRVDLSDYNKVDCPLCDGDGHFRGSDCPVCGGDAQMDKRYADNIDIREYQEVDCPLCEGSGRFDGDQCPACGGDAQIDRRYADRIDLREYEEVDCPLCEGKGRYEGRDCPECGGDARMQRRFADKIDINDYSKVDCPVCDGKGRRKGDDCPVCGGEAKIDRGDLQRIDVRDYEDVKCPICHGTGRVEGNDCRACGGEGEMERRHEQNIDPGDYR